MRPAVKEKELGFSKTCSLAAWASACALVFALGCSSNSADDGDDPDARPPRPPDGGSEYWDRVTVAEDGVGMHTTVAIKSDGSAAIAYYASWAYEDGVCDELDDPPVRMIWDMSYAEETSTGWDVELVEPLLVLGVPPGLDLKVSPTGTPVIAAMSGEPVVQIKYCGSNDVGLYSRTSPGNWTLDTAVVNSGEAATGLPASDYGEVVGHWPSLAYDTSGNPAVSYRDVHAGAMQGDDDRKADLELAWQTGGWTALPVDPGHGAGQFSKLLFDSTNQPVIVYANNIEETTENPQGVWVTRSPDGGTTWDKVRFFLGATIDGPDMVIDPDDDTIHVAYYDSHMGIPRLLTLTDDAQFTSLADGWTEEALGDPRFDEGYNPSIAVGPEGQLAIAFYRCVSAGQGLGNCDGTEDGLVFAWQEAGGWEEEVIDPGENLGFCGTYPSLAFDGDGHAVVAYQCQEMGDDGLEDQVRFARRDRL